MRRGVLALSLLLLTAVGVLAPPAHAGDAAKCTLRHITTVDMGISAGGRLTVPMTVGGQNLTMEVDSGGADSALNDAIVKTLGLRKDDISRAHVTMFGGTAITGMATGHDIMFGGLKAAKIDFLVIPDGRLQPGIDGLLAPDILRAYDDEFDFAAAKFSLFSPDHCPGAVVYWAKDFAQIDISLDRTGHIEIPVTLDGKEVKFDVDTGAEYTTLDWGMAQDLFGIDEHAPGVTRLTSDSGQVYYKYTFKGLTFGNAVSGAVTVSNPDILLVPYETSRMRGAIANVIGLGVLRKLHLYIAYQEHHLFVTSATAH